MKLARTAITMFFSALLIAFGFNQLLIPHQMISGGVSGIRCVYRYQRGSTSVFCFIFVLNVPILILGLASARRSFCWMEHVFCCCNNSRYANHTDNANCVRKHPYSRIWRCGHWIRSGLSLTFGLLHRRIRIIAAILTRKRDLSIGMLIFVMKCAVIAALGFLKEDWDIALYSLLSIFTANKIIDLIHIQQSKVTAFIVTSQTDTLRLALLAHGHNRHSNSRGLYR